MESPQDRRRVERETLDRRHEPETILEGLQTQRFFSDQIVHVQTLPPRPARYGEVPGGLHPYVWARLDQSGISSLYSHQAEAIGQLRLGKDVVIVTGTASGKTLCYNIPTVEALLLDPLATTLCLYPTKALTQDQLRAIEQFRCPEQGLDFIAGPYDGDTPQNMRTKLRDTGSVLLTNPDMLHQGILPHHARWNRFFSHLRYVVIDEIHAYRGVFGSNLACVLRRLARICGHYGTHPQFICCSATIANPGEHAGRITGREMALVQDDGSPRGPKRFVLWNPPPLTPPAGGLESPPHHGAGGPPHQGTGGPPQDGGTLATDPSSRWRLGGDRRSPLGEAKHLMASLVEAGVQTIAFVRTRLSAELLFRDVREALQPVSPRLAASVHAYRGGYLAKERREIERRLADREIMGVASTNALELGIDIGSLDACIIVGYPGTVASLWQQAGRAGRGAKEALIFLVGQNAPIDQYLMAHSDYVFSKSPEQAVVDPDNPHVVLGHLKCACRELPLADEAVELFGPYADVVLELLEEERFVGHIQGNWYWTSSEYPAATVNLRNISGPVYTIQDESEGERVIGTLDESSALSQLHDHAVYIHAGETYFVNRLDIGQKIAFVERRDLDYYTQSIQSSQIRIDETEDNWEWRGAALGFGDVTVTTAIPMFKKVRFESRDSLGFEQLELPPQELETVAMWLAPPVELARELMRRRIVVGEAIVGIANVLVEVAPLYVMCDVQDIGVTVDAGCLGCDALFLHDRYPGGMGYAHRCLEQIEQMLTTAYKVVSECGCSDGCPSCVGSAVPAFAMTDLDSAVRGRIPDKRGALELLGGLLG